jgi:hypothetical protein
MFGDIADEFAIEVDGATVFQRSDVFGAGFAIAHSWFSSCRGAFHAAHAVTAFGE